ncbi:MAG: hypothetical protein KatS3mg081_1892 [Gemmatimonadales bacterium]|nr:hypothetical protein HRbin33_01333 [bacterium HR33]GIW52537.1 MAG: hypothetical protein KatS3mg081_1892 [Gemmatimonadales bacterium]
MPIYDFRCKGCGAQFELLVRGQDAPQCPSCKSRELDRLISVPNLVTPTTRRQSMRSAKKREESRAKERIHDMLQYEKSHDRHG